MKTKTYLFQITVPSVQKFISSSRKSADLWAGSFMISYLMKKLLKLVVKDYQAELIYPIIENTQEYEKELLANAPNVAIFKIENDNPEIIKGLLQNEFQKSLNEFAKFRVVKLFDEDVNIEDIKKAFNIRSDEKAEEILEKRENIINQYKDKYLELSIHQIKESLKLFVEYLELEKPENYKEVSEDLANLINYEKKSQLPDKDFIENYQLIENPFKNKEKSEVLNSYSTWENFYNYEKNNNFQTGYIKGVYRCSSCGEHTIIGASLDNLKVDTILKNWKGDIIWKPLWEADSKYFNRGERLCGVCLAKRYFRDYLSGENLGFPSTSEIAATLFKLKALEVLKQNPDFNNLLVRFFENLEKIQKFKLRKVKGNPVPKLENEINKIFPADKNLEEDKQCQTYKFFHVDGEWFIEDIWKNPNDYETIGADDRKANQMLRTLQSIYTYLKDKGIEKHYKPSEYYAVIMLDGDNIGEKLDLIKNLENSIETHRNFSKKLSELSKDFKEIVEEYYGALVYSGGDDVLAFVPVEKALDCANEIQEKFRNTLKNQFPRIEKESKFTMSGAIIYAHHKLPLNFILDEARKCEEKAKEEGKNRVCLKYIKRSLSSNEVVLRWVDVKKFKNIPVNKQFAYQLRNFQDTFKFKKDYKKIKDLKPFYKRGYSTRDLGIKIRNLQENLLISLLKGKNLDISQKDFIKIIKRIDVYKTINIEDKNLKLKIYDFNKLENLLLVREGLKNE